MNKLTRTACTALASAAVLLALGAPVASATPQGRDSHVVVDGTWTDPGVTIDSATPTPWESLYVVKLHGNTTATGAFAGVSNYSFTLLANVATGVSRGNGVETFTATLAGRGSGTLTILEHLEVAADSSTTVAGLVIGGTGALAGAHGLMRFQGASQPGSPAGSGTYQLVLDFGR